MGPLQSWAYLWPILGNIFGITVCFAPWPLLSKASATNSVQAVQFFPLISLALSGWVWSLYGVLVSDIGIVVLNVLMLACAIRYVYVYLSLCRDWSSIMFQLQACAVLAGVYLAAAILLPSDMIDLLGAGAALVSIVSYASPLAGLREILATRRTDLLPMPLIATGIACATSWLLHGLARGDTAVTVSNALGLSLSLVQAVLWCVLRNGSKILPLAQPTGI
jgi:uncharacterized protein with PQ loop repeat